MLILRSLIIILISILSLSYAAYTVFSEGKLYKVEKGGMQQSIDTIIAKNGNKKHDNIQVQEVERILQENGIPIDTNLTIEEDEYILSRSTALALFDQGYDFYDIEVAKELAKFCAKTPLELLKTKGKSMYVPSEDDEQKNIMLRVQSKSWAEIVEELGIKIEKPTKVLGIAAEKIEELEQQNLDENEIEAVFAMAYNFQKDYQEIASELKRGSTVEELEKRYTEEREAKLRQKKVDEKLAKKNTEKILINKYQITEQDLEKFKKYGITNLVDIAFVKDLAIKSNMNEDQILELKNKYKSWSLVTEKAEVTVK